MNICFFHSSMRPGGIERTISLLANMYSLDGDTVSIVSLDGNGSFYRLEPLVTLKQLSLCQNSSGAMQALNNNAKRISSLRRCLMQIQPDVLVAFGPSNEIIGHIARLGLDIRLIGAERANPYLNTSSFWGKHKRKIACVCDGFLFQTKGASLYYPRYIQSRALIIANGIDAAKFYSSELPWNVRKNICTVGRMDDEKGIDDVIRAFATVHKQFPQVRLDIYGDGPNRGKLEALAKSMQISDYTSFHGQCSTIFEAYAEHKVFVMMSRQEGFPNVLLEAMASGCNCVAGNCDFGPAELIQDGINGYLVSVGDYNTAAQRIISILSNDADARIMSDRAKAVRHTNNITTVGRNIRQYLNTVVMR